MNLTGHTEFLLRPIIFPVTHHSPLLIVEGQTMGLIADSLLLLHFVADRQSFWP